MGFHCIPKTNSMYDEEGKPYFLVNQTFCCRPSRRFLIVLSLRRIMLLCRCLCTISSPVMANWTVGLHYMEPCKIVNAVTVTEMDKHIISP